MAEKRMLNKNVVYSQCKKYGKTAASMSVELGYESSWLSTRFTGANGDITPFTAAEVFALSHAIGCSVNDLVEPSHRIAESSVEVLTREVQQLHSDLDAKFDVPVDAILEVKKVIIELKEADHKDLNKIFSVVVPKNEKVTSTGKVLDN